MIVRPPSGASERDTDLSLPTVRSVISIVPQNPDLFEGTLRENIDPVGEYQDADIWVALEHVCIYSFVPPSAVLSNASSGRYIGSFEGVCGEPSRGSRCTCSRSRFVVVSWTEAVVVFCAGVVEKGKHCFGVRMREHASHGR